MKRWESFSKEEIEQFVKDSRSYAQLVEKLGYNKKSGSKNSTLKELIAKYNLDISHFKGKGWNKGNKCPNGKYVPFTDYISGDYYITSFKLHSKILREGLKERICESCGNTVWMGVDIPLEIHHIDGNKNNNQLDNLQFLCPNCHALTSNYRGKNKGKSNKIVKKNVNKEQKDIFKIQSANNLSEKKSNKKKTKYCIDCGEPISAQATRCIKCYDNYRLANVHMPSREYLKGAIRSKSFLSIGRDFNLTDNAIRRWCKKYDLPYRTKDIRSYSDQEWEQI